MAQVPHRDSDAAVGPDRRREPPAKRNRAAAEIERWDHNRPPKNCFVGESVAKFVSSRSRIVVIS